MSAITTAHKISMAPVSSLITIAKLIIVKEKNLKDQNLKKRKKRREGEGREKLFLAGKLS